MIKEPYPDHYTTPPDWRGCKNLVKDGPTPCWHPHCECFRETSETWDRPPGCYCLTLRERARCYEACDPTPPKDPMRRRILIEVFVAVVIFLLCCLFIKPAPAAEAYVPPTWQCTPKASWNDPRCPADEDKPAPAWYQFDCAALRSYLQFHTEEEARAEAKRLHFPQWLIRKAEKCPK